MPQLLGRASLGAFALEQNCLRQDSTNGLVASSFRRRQRRSWPRNSASGQCASSRLANSVWDLGREHLRVQRPSHQPHQCRQNIGRDPLSEKSSDGISLGYSGVGHRVQLRSPCYWVGLTRKMSYPWLISSTGSDAGSVIRVRGSGEGEHRVGPRLARGASGRSLDVRQPQYQAR